MVIGFIALFSGAVLCRYLSAWALPVLTVAGWVIIGVAARHGMAGQPLIDGGLWAIGLQAGYFAGVLFASTARSIRSSSIGWQARTGTFL